MLLSESRGLFLFLPKIRLHFVPVVKIVGQSGINITQSESRKLIHDLIGTPSLVFMPPNDIQNANPVSGDAMYRYWHWSEERIGLPVWPLALFPRRVYEGQGRLVYTATRLGRPTLRFEFDYVALRGLEARTYLAQEVPFSSALAARIRPGRRLKRCY